MPGRIVPGAGHAERGGTVASAPALARGGDPSTADAAGALVREPLLLAETASMADIDDEDTVLKVAARISRRGLVGPLYMLTAADSLATGPSSWDAWHASLVRTLVARLDAALANDVDGAGMVEQPSRSALRHSVSSITIRRSPCCVTRPFASSWPKRQRSGS